MASLGSDPIDERRLTLGEHLEELRGHVLRAVIYVVVALAVCLFFQEQLMRVAIWPHVKTARELKAEARGQITVAVPPETAAAARSSMEARGRLEDRLREVDREATAVRERLERDPAARARQLEQDARALEAKLTALRDELRALGAKPDEARARELEARRQALTAELQAFNARQAALAALADEESGPKLEQLVQRRYTDSFLAYIRVALVAALFLASPLVARELWRFVAKGLYPHEKRYVALFAPLTYVAFATGAAFGYFLLIPAGLKFLASYAGAEIVGQFDLSEYLSLFLGLTLVVGLMFELPLVMAFVALLGLVSVQTYAGFRRYWILVSFIIAAIITPTPDPITQTLCAVPLMILFEMGIWLSRLLVRRKDQAAEGPIDAVARAVTGAPPALPVSAPPPTTAAPTDVPPAAPAANPETSVRNP